MIAEKRELGMEDEMPNCAGYSRFFKKIDRIRRFLQSI